MSEDVTSAWEILTGEMDHRVCHLFRLHFDSSDNVSLVALGGYGRQEICPYSDIDFMILTEHASSQDLQPNIEKFLYALWDKGQKIGHSVRSRQECLDIARRDIKALTSLLDARFLAGNEAYYQRFTEDFFQSLGNTERQEFVSQLLAKRQERHYAMGDTRFVLEPNIKDGKGGLRDYQTLFWISKLLFNARTPEDLASQKILSKKEALLFRKAQSYLLTVRCHLHDLSGRAEERLSFDLQPPLAHGLGYQSRSHMKAVERFMRHVLLTMRDIGDLTRIICAELEQNPTQKTLTIQGYPVNGNRIAFPPNFQIQNDILGIFRLFELAEKNQLDIAPSALRMITQNLKYITEEVRQNIQANQLFTDILTGEKQAALILRRMNECGLLGKFLPDFAKITALMQFDRYHAFTVDEHILRAVDRLHQLKTGQLKQTASLASELIQQIASFKLLCIAVLLHDICKGRNGDHSELGARLSRRLGPRLGLNAKETALVSWLIKHHLLIGRTIMRRDLSDPKTIEDLTRIIPDQEHLDLLTVMTVADILAVGPGRWTAWKDSLVEELYWKTLNHISGVEMVARPTIPQLPKSYIPGNTWIDITNDLEKSMTILRVITPDQPGLFSKLAQGLTITEANIIEARISTLPDGTAYDEFFVQNNAGHIFDKSWRQKSLKRAVKDSIEGPPTQLRPHQQRQDNFFSVSITVEIKNELSYSNSVIEVSGPDRVGLLADLSAVLRIHDINIRAAKIATFGTKAIDSFYVCTHTGDKITDLTAVKQIKQDLYACF